MRRIGAMVGVGAALAVGGCAPIPDTYQHTTDPAKVRANRLPANIFVDGGVYVRNTSAKPLTIHDREATDTYIGSHILPALQPGAVALAQCIDIHDNSSMIGLSTGAINGYITEKGGPADESLSSATALLGNKLPGCGKPLEPAPINGDLRFAKQALRRTHGSLVGQTGFEHSYGLNAVAGIYIKARYATINQVTPAYKGKYNNIVEPGSALPRHLFAICMDKKDGVIGLAKFAVGGLIKVHPGSRQQITPKPAELAAVLPNCEDSGGSGIPAGAIAALR